MKRRIMGIIGMKLIRGRDIRESFIGMNMEKRMVCTKKGTERGMSKGRNKRMGIMIIKLGIQKEIMKQEDKRKTKKGR